MPNIFISYSHQDEPWKNRVVQQLQVLAPNGLQNGLQSGLQVWDDRQIAAGDGWQSEIEQAIAQCDAAVLLISAAFLTSKFILGEEVPRLLQRRTQQGVRVIPLIVEACAWQEISWLAPLQARPTDGKPLAGLRKHKANEALANLTKEIATLLKNSASAAKTATHASLSAASTLPPSTLPPSTAPLIDLSRLPHGAPHFVGRSAELALMDKAWAEAGGTAVLELIAPGGTGKTALLKRWLDLQAARGWGGAQDGTGAAKRVFAWSFYSQGTGAERQASDGPFLAAALAWFGVALPEGSSAQEQGQALAQALRRERCLLVLDGLEPLQFPPGPQGGLLRTPGLRTLLEQLIYSRSAGTPASLCLISSREALSDLDEWRRSSSNPSGAVKQINLGNLAPADGARLLWQAGANKAGLQSVSLDAASSDEEWRKVSTRLQGHALSLQLLGSYLRKRFSGDVRQWQTVDWAEADKKTSNGHVFRVLAAYEHWLSADADAEKRAWKGQPWYKRVLRRAPAPSEASQQAAEQLALLRLLGFFDRPADWGCLQALTAAPALKGLGKALQNLPERQWRIALQGLADLRLVTPPDPAPLSLDAHPLLREYFAQRLQTGFAAAWREGHRRLFEHLRQSAPHRPEGLAALQPLYQAVRHGCLAGQYEAARAEVYRDRILRGTGPGGFYSSKKLGAHGDNLAALAGFFDPAAGPWRQAVADISPADQGWVLGQAAYALQALGRVGEALAPTKAGAKMAAAQQDWPNAARAYNNLSELQAQLGQLAAAAHSAHTALDYAERSGDAFLRLAFRVTQAQAQALLGQRAPALALFAEAEAVQKEIQPNYPLLYSLQGHRYCNALLQPVRDRLVGANLADAAPHAAATSSPQPDTPPSTHDTPITTEQALRVCADVAARAEQTLQWAQTYADPLSIGFDHLTLARCALYADLLRQQAPGPAAQKHSTAAITHLGQAGKQDYLPRALLTQAELHHACAAQARSEGEGAQRQHHHQAATLALTEALRIATRSGLKLYLVDLALFRARCSEPPAQAQAQTEVEAQANTSPQVSTSASAPAQAGMPPAPLSYLLPGETHADALATARALIDECGYEQARPELQALQARWASA